MEKNPLSSPYKAKPIEELPSFLDEIIKNHPDIWNAYQKLTQATDASGPMDKQTKRLVKLALSIGAGSKGSVHSYTRRALKDGLSKSSLEQVALLSITSIGWSKSMAALSWIREITNNFDI